MAPKAVIAAKSKAARIEARRKLGQLEDIIVSPATKSRYRSAVHRIFHWLSLEGIAIPSDNAAFDTLLARYIEHLWCDGDGRSTASNTVAGLQHFVPTLKKTLVCSWRLLSAWAKHELPARAPPLTLFLLQCLSGAAMSLKQPNLVVLLRLAFYGLLRTGEACNLVSQDVSVQSEPLMVVVNLGLTKGGARQGAAESVVIEDAITVRLTAALKTVLQPGDPLFPGGAGKMRKVFGQRCQLLLLSERGFRPYSLRRGGATFLFRKTGSLATTVVKGRWASAKMARIYLNDGLATLASFDFNENDARLAKYQRDFAGCVT